MPLKAADLVRAEDVDRLECRLRRKYLGYSRDIPNKAIRNLAYTESSATLKIIELAKKVREIIDCQSRITWKSDASTD